MQFLIFFLRIILALWLVLSVPSACGPDKQVIINQKVAEKEMAFRDKRSIECRSSLLAEAEEIVDSLLLAEAKMELGDSLTRLRPAKPAKPAPVPPIDSLKVQPIFKQPAASDGKK